MRGRTRLSLLVAPLLLLLLHSGGAVAQPIAQANGPNPLRSELPRAADLPGFTQFGDGPITLVGVAADSAPHGVMRAFIGPGQTGLQFQLYQVAGAALDAVAPSSAGEAILRATAGNDSSITGFQLTGRLNVGSDDLSAVWTVAGSDSNPQLTIYGDFFLHANTLALVLYESPAASADSGALVTNAQLLDGRIQSSPTSMPDWTFTGEQTVVTSQSGDDSSQPSTTARIWFAPGSGWRVEISSTGSAGTATTVFGSDETTDWQLDQTTGHYSQQPSSPASGDPRLLFLGGELGFPGTNDLASELAVWRSLPNTTVKLNGTDTVLGRATQRVLISPASCSSSSSDSGSAGACSGTVEYWFDLETGWVLRARGDEPGGGTFDEETTSATFDAPIDSSLFRFTAP